MIKKFTASLGKILGIFFLTLFLTIFLGGPLHNLLEQALSADIQMNFSEASSVILLFTPALLGSIWYFYRKAYKDIQLLDLSGAKKGLYILLLFLFTLLIPAFLIMMVLSSFQL